MKSLCRHLSIVLLQIITVLGVIGLLIWQKQGLRFYSVQTDSMQPTLYPGDLIATQKIPANQLKTGYIVSYHSLQDPSALITHRIKEVNLAKGFIITQGDNLQQPDPAIPINSIEGREIKAIPLLGNLFDTIRRPIGLIGFIYLPSMVILAAEAGRLIGKRTNGLYSATK